MKESQPQDDEHQSDELLRHFQLLNDSMIAHASFEVVDMDEEEKRDAKEAASSMPQKPKKKYEDGFLSKIKSSEIIKSYSSAKKNFANQYDKTVLSSSAYREKQLHQQQSEQVKLDEYRKALEK